MSDSAYLQHAQIIQGVLILVSAIVGVTGYVVQARLRARERVRELEDQHQQHLRKLQLERCREQVRSFLGPAVSLVLNLQYACLT